ncbi:MAG: M1 family metallopeptidase [Alphaproteobacteria bacterium]|nr:M1 family metallopeptidase [Alphaproteobacteria bacterium]
MKKIALFFGMLVALITQAALAAPDRVVLPDDVTPVHYDLAVVPNAAAKTFTGSVRIAIDVHKATTQVELNAADLAFSHVALSGVASAPKVSYDKDLETATLTFPSAVAPGHYILAINYTGKINDNAAGLFHLDYDTAHGKKRALFTQFENSDARRFVPCWDEPAHKATFTLTATVPADEMAVSNMPVTVRMMLGGGLERVQFAETPEMSSYLLFFGLGDFDRISRKVDGVDIGVIVKHGDLAQAGYALDAAAHILPFYENYFGVKYPLPKLDLIAGPGQSQFFGAMENWGAIFFFERDLLVDPKISTAADKHGVYMVVAHEMAHMWSGDLVTMQWWDGIWLNEGFASWMEYKATNQFNPTWNVWLGAMGAKERAMRVDARAGTHPIIQPIHDVFQANEAFDTITYSKGMSVIRMLENYVGDDAWRDGMRAYIKKYAYSNAVTDDLWAEIDKTSKTPITDIAHEFTLQAGVPLIRVAATASGIRLTQDRFAVDDSGKAPTTWQVPVVEKSLGAKHEWRGLVVRGKPIDIAEAKGAVPIVNAGQAGYFRTLYDQTLAAKLAAHFRALQPIDQLGLLNDEKALGYAGYQPITDVLALIGQARAGMNPSVLADVAEQVSGVDALYRDLPGRAAFRAYGLRVLQPLFAAVGWTPRAGEDANMPMLRSELLAALSQLDDPSVIAAARARFATYLKNPGGLTGDLRSSVLSIVAEHADATTWEQLHTLAMNTQSSLEKRQYYRLLGSVHDRTLAARALDIALTDEAPVTMRPAIVASVAVYHPKMALDFAAAHVDAINAALEPDSRNEFAPELASNSYDPAIIPKLQAYADAHISTTARSPTVRAVATITYAAMVRAKRLPAIDAWLKQQH